MSYQTDILPNMKIPFINAYFSNQIIQSIFIRGYFYGSCMRFWDCITFCVANRLGSNKIQCSLTYKNLFMLYWLTHDVLQSIIIPGRLIWWWCQELIHVPYEDNGVVCCQIGKLLPTYTFLVGLFLNTGKQVTKLSVFCTWDVYIELLILFLRKD